MKKISVLKLAGLAAVVLTTFSCNRGVGCPTNFTIGDAIEWGAHVAGSIIF